MARTWRNERTDKRTSKQHAQHMGQEGTKRPRMSDFARDYYQSKGYVVEEYCDDAEGYRRADA